jgi:YcaO-like protein with predicted kinase domain
VSCLNASASNNIDSGRKAFFQGTHRVLAPSTTLELVNRVLPRLGITRVANITGLDRVGIPVCMVCRPNSRSLSVSQGKGLDLLSAKASGVMESVESYHAEHIDLPLILSSFDELCCTHSIPDPHQLPQSKKSNWTSELPLQWIEGFDLATENSAWVPFEVVHLNLALESMPGEGSFITSSSGLASGNHPLEAISHAICELVERDALALWRLPFTRSSKFLDLQTVDDPDCIWLIDKFRAAGITPAVWDVTSDVGIATFVCCALEEHGNSFHPIPAAPGSGCHPSRAIALSRALTEAAQCRATLIAGSRDDLSAADYEYLFSPKAAAPWRNMMQPPPEHKFQDTPDFRSDSLQDDVDWELQQLQQAGLKQVMVVDLTKPEFRIPVVRVVIPGLEPDDPGRRLGPRSKAILDRWLGL